MNRSVQLVLRGIAGVTVLAILLFTVNNWWRDYKDAPAHGVSQESTATPQGAGEDSKSQATGSEAGQVVVVLVDGLKLQSKPEKDAKSVRGLNKGERLTLVKTDGAWYAVKTSEGDDGWISSNPSYSKIEKK